MRFSEISLFYIFFCFVNCQIFLVEYITDSMSRAKFNLLARQVSRFLITKDALHSLLVRFKCLIKKERKLVQTQPHSQYNNLKKKHKRSSQVNFIVWIIKQIIDNQIRSKSMSKLAILLLLVVVTMAAEKDYTEFVNTIKDNIAKDPFKHSAWNRLAYITDTYGPRMWGSSVLQMVIADMKKQATEVGFDNIRLEPVSNFEKWVRGKESLHLLSPRQTKLDVIGLGASVSSNGPIVAEVVVVRDYTELEAKKALVKGRIVCYNNPWVNYHDSVSYRVEGPSKAAAHGALATLVRSVASQSIYSVHTGYMEYDPAHPKIPCGAITVEDAEMFQRMQDRGQVIKVNLTLMSQFVKGANSNNLIFEIKGTQFPKQIVLAGGHIDTWDTGSQTGANDDGGGFITVFQAFRMLKQLNFKPRRTMRFIAWSGEESGSYIDGAAQYTSSHKAQLDLHVAAFESDLGSTLLQGFGYQGPDKGKAIVQDILTKYLSILGAGEFKDFVQAVDTQPLQAKGIPVLDNKVKDTPEHNFYFRYHHSAGDSMSMMDPDDMDSNVAGIAAFLYIVADLETTIRDFKLPNLQLD